MTVKGPQPAAATADLPQQAREQTMLGRMRMLAEAWPTFVKVLGNLPAELEAAYGDNRRMRERVGYLEAELTAARSEINKLRYSKSALGGVSGPPPIPADTETQHVSDIDIDDVWEDVPDELREITKDFETRMGDAIRRLQDKEIKR